MQDAVDVESIVSAVTDAKYEDLVIVHGPSLRRYGVTFPNHVRACLPARVPARVPAR